MTLDDVITPWHRRIDLAQSGIDESRGSEIQCDLCWWQPNRMMRWLPGAATQDKDEECPA
jgi:hypothetical protein